MVSIEMFPVTADELIIFVRCLSCVPLPESQSE